MQIHTDVQQADIAFGYGSEWTVLNETFRFRGNGAFVVHGNSGVGGQVLMSNGPDAPAYWGNINPTFPTFQFFSQTGDAMNLSSNPANIPGIHGQKFTTKFDSKLMITVSAEIQIDAGEPEQKVYFGIHRHKKFGQQSYRQFKRLYFNETYEIAFCKTQ